MAISGEIGVGDLFSKFFTNTFVIFGNFALTRAISTLSL